MSISVDKAVRGANASAERGQGSFAPSRQLLSSSLTRPCHSTRCVVTIVPSANISANWSFYGAHSKLTFKKKSSLGASPFSYRGLDSGSRFVPIIATTLRPEGPGSKGIRV